MNRIYKTRFNRRLGVWQAVPETARGASRGKASTIASAVVLGVALLGAQAAWADNLLVGDGGAGGASSGSGRGGGGGIGGGGGGGVDAFGLGAGGGGGIGRGINASGFDGGNGGSGGGAGGAGGAGGGVDGAGPSGGSGDIGGGGSGGNRNRADGGGGGAIGANGGGAGGHGGGSGGNNGGGGGSSSGTVGSNGSYNPTTSVSTALELSTPAAYDFVGVGGGGGGGAGLNGRGSDGAAGNLHLNNATLSVNRSMLIGGAGGGAGGFGGWASGGGSGGTGQLVLENGAILSVAETLLVGGSGGGNSAAREPSGGGGGSGSVTTAAGTSITVNGQLILGGDGGNGSGAGGTGTLNLGGSLAFGVGASPLTIRSGSTLNFGNATPGGTTTQGITGLTSLVNDGTLNFNQANTTTLDASISGAGTLNQNGSGTTILTGNNSYSGATTIQGGTLQIGNGGTTGTLGTGTVTNNGVLSFNHNGTLTVSNTLTGSGSVRQSGPGTLVLGGTNSYSGGTALNAGTLRVGPNNALGTGRLTMAAGTTLQQASASVTLSNAITLNGTATIEASGVLTLQGGITGSGGLTKTGGYDLLIEGVGNNYTGATYINDGMMYGVTDNVLSAASAFTIASGAALSVGGSGQTIGSLAGDGAAAGGTVSAGTLTTGANNASTTFSGGLFNGWGTLALVKTGSGAMILSGVTSDYSGGTTINAGTISVSDDRNLGAASGRLTFGGGTLQTTANVTTSRVTTLTANGTFDTAAGTALAHTGTIDGGGGLTKTGNGTLELSGNNAYSGGTALNAGTLRVGHNNALGTGRLTMAANTTLLHSGFSLTLGNAITLNGAAAIDVADANFSLTLQGSMSGSGGLTKTGGGTLHVSGAGSNYAGATNINAGAIWSATDNSLSPASDFTVASGAILLAGGSQAIGSLAGGGMAWGGILGASTLTTGGSGATTTFSGNLSDGWGTLALVKTGSGTMTLSGANTHTGGTTINGGTLAVNGSIVGNTTVNNGGALGGTGTVGNVTVASGGALAPGNSIGTLNVTGDLAFAAGSIYLVEVDASGAADRVNATGNITINGGTVDVQAGGGTYQRNTRYTILNSGGTTTGQFAGVTTNLAFLTPTLVYEANGVLLDLRSSAIAGYASVARTGNEAAVANHLQSFANTPGNAQAAALIQQFDNMTAEQAAASFASMAGTAHTSASQVAGGLGRNFSASLAARSGFGTGALGSAMNDWRGTQYASLDRSRFELVTVVSDVVAQAGPARGAETPAAQAQQRGLWAQALGAGGRMDSDGNAAGSRYSSSGFVLGYDQPVAGQWIAGAALGYSTSSWNATSGSAASGKIASPQAGLYARYAGDKLRVRLDATLASHRFTTDRTVTIGGASASAHSEHTGREWGLAGQVEMPVQAGEWELRPLAGLRHAQLKEGGFTETGPSAANLSVARRTTQSTLLYAGMHFVRPFDDGKGGLELRATASHLAGDNDSPVTASIAGQPGGFTAAGVPLKRNALTLGTTVSGQLARNVSAYLDANYEHRGSGQNAYRLTGGVRVSF